jgi:hypothetical protein
MNVQHGKIPSNSSFHSYLSAGKGADESKTKIGIISEERDHERSPRSTTEIIDIRLCHDSSVSKDDARELESVEANLGENTNKETPQEDGKGV